MIESFDKRCRVCKQEKPRACFHRNKTMPDGLCDMCKECDKAYRKRKKQTNPTRLIALRSWGKIKKRAAHQTDSGEETPLLMTEEEFFAWAIPRIEEWVNLNPGKTPVIQIVDHKGNYELSNLHLVGYREALGNTARCVNNTVPYGHKQCGHCKQVLPFSAFKPVREPRSYGKFGLYGWCDTCRRYDNLEKMVKARNDTLELRARIKEARQAREEEARQARLREYVGEGKVPPRWLKSNY